MATRSKLWLPFQTISNTTSAATQNKQSIDGSYGTLVGAEFKGTLIAVRAWVTMRQDAISNALEAFSCAIRVASKQQSATDNDLVTTITNDPARLDVVLGGPGADTTGLADVMQTFTFPLMSNSKRLVGFNDEISFVWKTSGAGKIGCVGRLLLLEA